MWHGGIFLFSMVSIVDHPERRQRRRAAEPGAVALPARGDGAHHLRRSTSSTGRSSCGSTSSRTGLSQWPLFAVRLVVTFACRHRLLPPGRDADPQRGAQAHARAPTRFALGPVGGCLILVGDRGRLGPHRRRPPRPAHRRHRREPERPRSPPTASSTSWSSPTPRTCRWPRRSWPRGPRRRRPPSPWPSPSAATASTAGATTCRNWAHRVGRARRPARPRRGADHGRPLVRPTRCASTPGSAPGPTAPPCRSG